MTLILKSSQTSYLVNVYDTTNWQVDPSLTALFYYYYYYCWWPSKVFAIYLVPGSSGGGYSVSAFRMSISADLWLMLYGELYAVKCCGVCVRGAVSALSADCNSAPRVRPGLRRKHFHCELLRRSGSLPPIDSNHTLCSIAAAVDSRRPVDLLLWPFIHTLELPPSVRLPLCTPSVPADPFDTLTG